MASQRRDSKSLEEMSQFKIKLTDKTNIYFFENFTCGWPIVYGPPLLALYLLWRELIGIDDAGKKKNVTLQCHFPLKPYLHSLVLNHERLPYRIQ